MGLTFEPFDVLACCLCGQVEDPTGEHKIKASILRAEFGAQPMVIRRGDGDFRPARGPKAKVFHFDAPMCSACNNERTQPADKAFDGFNAAARALLAKGEDPLKAFDVPGYRRNAPAYLDLFRYFAKLLCAHMAESRAPRPVHMSRFARGLETRNPVWLAVDRDWTYQEAAQTLGEHPYAAHGGLVVYGHNQTGAAHGFHSTLTVGPLRYVFYSRLTLLERLELRLAHRAFTAWCADQVHAAAAAPLTRQVQLELGLAAAEER